MVRNSDGVWMTTTETAKALSVSTARIRERIARGDFPTARRTRRNCWLVHTDDVRKSLAQTYENGNMFIEIAKRGMIYVETVVNQGKGTENLGVAVSSAERKRTEKMTGKQGL